MNKYAFLEAMDKKGFKSQRDFARTANISHKVLSNQLNGKSKISTDDASEYCKLLEIKDDETIVKIFFPTLSLIKDN